MTIHNAIHSFIAFLTVLFLTLPAVAQNPEELKGMQVQDQQGEEMGTVSEVITDQNQQIEAVVVEKGGFLGLGGEDYRIPWNAVKEAPDGNYLIYTPGSETEQERVAQQPAMGDEADIQPEGQQPGDEADIQPEVAEQEPKADQEKNQVARQEPQSRQDEGGQVTVQQPGAQVQVDQADPRVQVQQQEPEVSVSQTPPEVIVEQQPPQVQVEVHQPEPEVTVQQQQPQVDVQQQDPQVAVEQPKPEVDVRQQEPEVTVQQAEPEVQVAESGEAKVFVEEQEKADVEVQRQGQPEVDVVTRQQQDQSTQSLAQMDPAEAEELMDREIIDQNGENLGTVKKASLAQDGNSVEYLIVQGEENQMHPIPVQLVEKPEGDQPITAQIDKQTFEDSPSFSQDEDPQLTQQQWSQEIQTYYGVSPAWQEEQNQQSPQSEKQPSESQQ